MKQHYPKFWFEYLMDQCNDQQRLNFETEILPLSDVKKELIGIQNLLLDLHDALIFKE